MFYNLRTNELEYENTLIKKLIQINNITNDRMLSAMCPSHLINTQISQLFPKLFPSSFAPILEHHQEILNWQKFIPLYEKHFSLLILDILAYVIV